MPQLIRPQLSGPSRKTVWIAMAIEACGAPPSATQTADSEQVSAENAEPETRAIEPLEPSEQGLTRDDVIAALEDFIERHPSGQYTQEARFRLAVLYLERETQADASFRPDDPPSVAVVPSRDDSIRVLQEYLAVEGADAATGDQRANAAFLLGTCFWDTDEVAEALDTWRAVVCPEWDASTTYATCHPIARGRAIGGIWARLGHVHFLESEYDLAVQAFEYASEVAEPSVRQQSLYMRGWLRYADLRYEEALEVLARVLEGNDGRLVDVSVRLSGDALANNDWDVDSLPDQETVVSRCRTYAQAHQNLVLMPQVVLSAVDSLIQEGRYPEAQAVLSIAQDYPDRFEQGDVDRRQDTIRQRSP